jgi:bifunctional oligoribonuclease and PAP phosphatase NrnA
VTATYTREPGGLLRFCEQARAEIGAARRILLAAHIFPEADSVGSQAALARHLHQLGKQVIVRNPSPVQEIYHFLIDLSGLDAAAWDDGDHPLPAHDLVIVLDVSDWDYMGALGAQVRKSTAPKILFDHHQARVPEGTLALIDPEASSTGEVLYRYFLATGAAIDEAMAGALYASILFDTGSFRFRNARDETLLIASELIRLGASHTETVARLFENESFSRVELLTAALTRVVSELDGKVAWTYLSEEMFARTGTTAVDADGVIDHMMAIRGVQLAVLFRELPGCGVKVTFRSKGGCDVSRLAIDLGGGGRPTAAGATRTGALKAVIQDVLPFVRALLEPCPAGVPE